MQRKRLPAVVNEVVWKKSTKGNAGIRWDRVMEKVWKEEGGNQDEILSIDEGAGYKTKVRNMIKIRGK
ncbi:unnamed protein product [Sphacelaria rigidula]